MDLTHTQTVEHADSQSVGCCWHRDPACLCDVDLACGVMGDDDYVINPGLEEAWTSWDRDDDGWLPQAFNLMVWDTWRRSLSAHTSAHQVMTIVDEHPEAVSDLLGGCSRSQVTTKYGLSKETVQGLVKFLHLRDHSTRNRAIATKPIRELAVSLYDDGMTVTQVRAHLDGLGVPQPHVNVCKWMQRWSKRYAVENPETTLLGVAA